MKILRLFCFFLGLVLFADSTFAADTRIKNLANTTTTVESDDFFVVDGNTNGTRKLAGSSFYRYGNIIVSGQTTVVANNTGNITLVEGTGITITTDNTAKSITITATNTGNVTAASTYGTDNVALRSDGTGRGSQGSSVTIDDSGNIVTSGNITGNIGTFTTGNYTTINATTLNVTTLNATNAVGTGNVVLSPGGVTVTTAKVLTVNNSLTFNGTDSTVFTFPSTSGTVVTKSTNIVTFVLTIDDLADSLNYDIGFVGAAFTVAEIRVVHFGSGLSSPSVVATVKHGTDRTSGSTVHAVTATSSTTGTSVTSAFTDATIPANSFIWVETGSKSGTTDNLTIIVRGTYD